MRTHWNKKKFDLCLLVCISLDIWIGFICVLTPIEQIIIMIEKFVKVVLFCIAVAVCGIFLCFHSSIRVISESYQSQLTIFRHVTLNVVTFCMLFNYNFLLWFWLFFDSWGFSQIDLRCSIRRSECGRMKMTPQPNLLLAPQFIIVVMLFGNNLPIWLRIRTVNTMHKMLNTIRLQFNIVTIIIHESPSRMIWKHIELWNCKQDKIWAAFKLFELFSFCSLVLILLYLK